LAASCQADKSQFYDERVQDRIWIARDENMLEVENKTVAPRQIRWPFYGIPTGSMLLQYCVREFYSTGRGSSMETWSPWLRKSSRLGEIQSEENK
jgi:hypothetical protein